jgi:uncharacterized protein Yka (UPF0111/DUF47 family)
MIMTIESADYNQLLDELDQLDDCLEAIAELMNPEPEIHERARDRICALVHRMVDERRAVLDKLRDCKPK